ncbi:DUF1534 domain-containing protein [Pseudomonas syringae]|nr:DUF1534 domain-containing protein [Pseudomonas syringae]MCF5485464.1 DUF1534 domain-containing protein [Pseudomonas syringae]MCF5499765.1 DUF1534 domain-containing protein [Pseudomonas syringae]MCF5505929.1 DUF1534 domain-containing protein [Pseudomonas syringae]MCF5527081.1 DUF1534 domain-containing protein [Pseudomonas syringae]
MLGSSGLARDALCHKSTLHRTFKIGRRASRPAFPRWSVRNERRSGGSQI